MNLMVKDRYAKIAVIGQMQAKGRLVYKERKRIPRQPAGVAGARVL